MIFSTCEGASSAAAPRLDVAMEAANVERNMDKDVNDAINATCLGVDLVDGSRWEAPGSRIFSAMADLVALVEAPYTSPHAMAQYLGSVQWYDLLCQPKLSCYDEVYGFTRSEPQHAPIDVPSTVLDELLTSVALSAWWSVPLHREFAPFLVATDASTGHGFGGCVADATMDEVRAISRLCAKVGDSVVLGSSDRPPTSATGRQYHLGAEQKNFKTIFCIKAKHVAHINVLEMSALNLGLEWVLRSPRRHHKRVAFLLDSKVVIGGAAKGRSSSKPLLRELTRTAPLVMAGSLQPHYIYINTKDNPSDAPSRGLHRRSKEPRPARRFRHYLANQARCYQRLVDCGHLRDFRSDSGSSNSCSSAQFGCGGRVYVAVAPAIPTCRCIHACTNLSPRPYWRSEAARLRRDVPQRQVSWVSVQASSRLSALRLYAGLAILLLNLLFGGAAPHILGPRQDSIQHLMWGCDSSDAVQRQHNSISSRATLWCWTAAKNSNDTTSKGKGLRESESI